MKTKIMLILLLLFFLVGCVEIQVVVKKEKDKSLIPAYPSPRSDIRLLQEGAYPYPIEY